MPLRLVHARTQPCAQPLAHASNQLPTPQPRQPPGPEHLLLGLLAGQGSAASRLLAASDVDLAAARGRLDALHVLPTGAGRDQAADVDFAPALQVGRLVG
jgi:hypothetical protein